MEERYESELARSAAVLDEVDRALDRLSEGTYATCEACGASLPEADLEADPTRTTCAAHRRDGSTNPSGTDGSAAPPD